MLRFVSTVCVVWYGTLRVNNQQNVLRSTQAHFACLSFFLAVVSFPFFPCRHLTCLCKCKGMTQFSYAQTLMTQSQFVGWLLNVPATRELSQRRICSDNFTCCLTEIEVADQTFYLTQSQYTDTGPTSPSADPVTTRRLTG